MSRNDNRDDEAWLAIDRKHRAAAGFQLMDEATASDPGQRQNGQSGFPIKDFTEVDPATGEAISARPDAEGQVNGTAQEPLAASTALAVVNAPPEPRSAWRQAATWVASRWQNSAIRQGLRNFGTAVQSRLAGFDLKSAVLQPAPHDIDQQNAAAYMAASAENAATLLPEESLVVAEETPAEPAPARRVIEVLETPLREEQYKWRRTALRLFDRAQRYGTPSEFSTLISAIVRSGGYKTEGKGEDKKRSERKGDLAFALGLERTGIKIEELEALAARLGSERDKENIARGKKTHEDLMTLREREELVKSLRERKTLAWEEANAQEIVKLLSDIGQRCLNLFGDYRGESQLSTGFTLALGATWAWDTPQRIKENFLKGGVSDADLLEEIENAIFYENNEPFAETLRKVRWSLEPFKAEDDYFKARANSFAAWMGQRWNRAMEAGQRRWGHRQAWQDFEGLREVGRDFYHEVADPYIEGLNRNWRKEHGERRKEEARIRARETRAGIADKIERAKGKLGLGPKPAPAPAAAGYALPVDSHEGYLNQPEQQQRIAAQAAVLLQAAPQERSQLARDFVSAWASEWARARYLYDADRNIFAAHLAHRLLRAYQAASVETVEPAHTPAAAPETVAEKRPAPRGTLREHHQRLDEIIRARKGEWLPEYIIRNWWQQAAEVARYYGPGAGLRQAGFFPLQLAMGFVPYKYRFGLEGWDHQKPGSQHREVQDDDFRVSIAKLAYLARFYPQGGKDSERERRILKNHLSYSVEAHGPLFDYGTEQNPGDFEGFTEAMKDRVDRMIDLIHVPFHITFSGKNPRETYSILLARAEKEDARLQEKRASSGGQPEAVEEAPVPLTEAEEALVQAVYSQGMKRQRERKAAAAAPKDPPVIEVPEPGKDIEPGKALAVVAGNGAKIPAALVVHAPKIEIPDPEKGGHEVVDLPRKVDPPQLEKPPVSRSWGETARAMKEAKVDSRFIAYHRARRQEMWNRNHWQAAWEARGGKPLQHG